MHTRDGEGLPQPAPPAEADTGRPLPRRSAPPGAEATRRPESGDRLRQAMQIETVGIVFFDAEGGIRDCNEAFLRMSGLRRDRVPLPLTALAAPGSRQAAEQALAQFREIGRVAPTEQEYVRPDGSPWWALFSATRLEVDEGVGYLIDVTEQRRAESSRRATEAEFRAMFELSSVGQCQVDLATGTVALANLRFCLMVGFPADELARIRFEGLVHVEDRPAVLAMLAQLVDGRLHESTIETRLVRADGGVVLAEGNVTVMRDASGVPVRMAAIVRDVSVQRQTEQALAESRERLRLVLESARDYAILSTDLQRRITSWNPGAERITGYAEAEALGQPADILFTDADLARGEAEREARVALAAGRALEERWHRRKDGRAFWASGVTMAMNDPHGRPVGLVKIFRDETEARASSEALKQSRAQLWKALRENERARGELQAASRAKDQFLSALSHELRTPLTPVLMAAQALGMRHDLPEGVRPALEMIQRNVRIEAHFIDDLLELTRISRGTLDIVFEPTDLHAAVQAAVAACRSHLEQKAIQLEMALGASRHRFDGDRCRLEQAFSNVLRNAVKFTPQGGRIVVRSEDAGDGFRLTVQDTGIGIDAERLPGIFEAFNQGGEWVARKYGGLGLGLAIARATVEAHGGSIRAESAGTEQGTALFIEFPSIPQQGRQV